jgi:tellurite resistance protein TerC
MTIKKAVAWTLFWIGIAFVINVIIYFQLGTEKAIQFLTGYVIEESLSVDNLFVFLIIFSFFKITPTQQRRVLNYGIVGVIILRGIMILLGSVLIANFAWVLYLFGIFLIYSGYKITFGNEIEVHPENNFVMNLFKKIFPIKENYAGNKIFIKDQNKWFATSLLVVLIVIETTDVVFAVDSIPAVFGITTDPIIIFSSNFMAVLGLRSIYFVLEKIHSAFMYVKYGVGVVLVFVGIKMLCGHIYPIGTLPSLCIVLTILALSVLLSIIQNNFHLIKNNIK